MRGIQATSILAFSLLATVTLCQQAGHLKDNYHIPMPIKVCKSKGNCSMVNSTSVTLDSGWRWLHDKDGKQQCYTGQWSQSLCPDASTCAKQCYYDGVPQSELQNNNGLTKINGGVKLNYISPNGYVGSRSYLLNGENYYIFKLLNQEISVTIDLSTLPCGTDASFYFSEMEADGGKKHGNNQAGAPYGTGYCDAQCPKYLSFINGEANMGNKYGACCAELDIIEANSYASALTLHPCNKPGLFKCSGGDCDNNGQVCEKQGCDINPYRIGEHNFYGRGTNYKINTLKPFTIVTQFKTHNGTEQGYLTEINRVWIQDGKVLPSPKPTYSDLSKYTSHSDEFCQKEHDLFKQGDKFKEVGGMKSMGEALRRGMVLVMSLWDDGSSRMTWLDSKVPANADPNYPGVMRGECATDSGDPAKIRKEYASSYVKYYDVKVGPLGSTYGVTEETFIN